MRFWILLLAFTVLPAVELYILITIGTHLGPGTTVMLILITGLVGAWMARREGLAVVTQLTEELQQGLPPGSRLVEGGLVLAGGLLLMTPGVLTDLAGFSFILPWTRRALAPPILGYLKDRFVVTSVGDSTPVDGWPDDAPRRRPRPPRDADEPDSPFDHPVR